MKTLDYIHLDASAVSNVVASLKKLLVDYQVLSFKIKDLFIDNEERSLTIRQQKSVASFLLFLVVVLQSIYIIGIMDIPAIYQIFNWAVLLVLVIIVAIRLFGKISLKNSFVILQVFMQAEISLEILLHAVDYQLGLDELHPRSWITVGMLLSLLFLMLTVCSYKHKQAFVQATMALGAYIGSVLITDSSFLMFCLPLYIVIFVLMIMLGKLLNNNIHELQIENEMLKKEERVLLKLLPFNKEELLAFTELVSCETMEKKTVKLLDNIGEIARNNLYAVVRDRIKEEDSQKEIVEKVFPELSPSELTICSLILQDKTVGEICALLGKTSGNITSQRVHIRAKLGLEKDDNLKKVLQERMKRYEDENVELECSPVPPGQGKV